MANLMHVFSAAAVLGLAAHAAEPDTEAVEYYNVTLNHYFITATASEARLIDDGAAGPGWVRTGRSFQAWLDPAGAPAGAAGVCRFYSFGANSHFYTPDAGECEFLKGLEAEERRAAQATGAPLRGWLYEGIAFRIEAPSGGQCPGGSTALYRLYNDGFASGEGSNHRYVDDSDLRALMVDRAWIGEGNAMCARAKAGGSNANLPPTSTNFEALAGAWTGTAKWKKGEGAQESRVSAPLSLDITAAGAVAGSGLGCAFAGQVQSGDGFRSLFLGTITASGCSDPAFDGAYARLGLERFGNGTLSVRLKKGDGASEVSVEAVLAAAASPASAAPPTTLPAAGLAGTWAGTVGWTATRRQGGVETVLVASNRPLSLAIGGDGAMSGSGFGCSLSGALSTTATAGVFMGSLSASGCAEAAFDGAYASVKAKRDDGMLEVEFEKESESAGVTTKAVIDGKLASGASTPGTPPPPAPAGGIAGAYAGAATATVEVRNRTTGTTTTTSASGSIQLSVTATGAVTGSGFGCAFAGSLVPSASMPGIHAGSIAATGCTNPVHDGSYAASAHLENGVALDVEMERESESGDVRTKVRIDGTLPRSAG